MIHRIIILAIWLLPCTNILAQVSEPFPKPSFELGVGLQFNKFTGDLYDRSNSQFTYSVPVNQLTYAYAVMGSLNIPFKMVREKLYLGINPNVDIAYSYRSFQTDVPLFLTLKYGAGSNKNDESRLGFGIGAGGYFSAFHVSFISTSGHVFNYGAIYVAPAAMAEFSFRTNYQGIYQIRVDFTPVPVPKDGNSFIGNLGQFNIRLIRPF